MRNILICLTLFLFSCKKDPLTYTTKMAGMHSWSGFLYGSVYSQPFDTFYSVAFDAPIAVVNERTIIFDGGTRLTTLNYLTSDEARKTITFVASGVGGSGFDHIHDTLVFNYSTNAISHSEYWGGAHASSYQLIHAQK